MNGRSQEAKAMSGQWSSFPDNKRSTWRSEVIAALTESGHEKWLDRINRAQAAILHRLDVMEGASVSLGDVNERCAMSYALSVLRTLSGGGAPATQGEGRANATRNPFRVDLSD